MPIIVADLHFNQITQKPRKRLHGNAVDLGAGSFAEAPCNAMIGWPTKAAPP
jgi:hypothetical protein